MVLAVTESECENTPVLLKVADSDTCSSRAVRVFDWVSVPVQVAVIVALRVFDFDCSEVSVCVGVSVRCRVSRDLVTETVCVIVMLRVSKSDTVRVCDCAKDTERIEGLPEGDLVACDDGDDEYVGVRERLGE